MGKGMPDPNLLHPISGYDKLIYAKPNIIIQIISLSASLLIPDSEFESHATHYYELTVID
jgi:virginiamycin A acetyltransferase